MKIIIGIITLVLLAGCTVTYTAKDVISGTNRNLPKKIDLKVATLITKSLKSINFDEKEQRLIFVFEAKVENKIKDFDCKAFKLSAKPVLKEGKVFMTEARAEDINCTLPLTDAINVLKDTFFSNLEVETVQLEGMKKALAKKIYIEGNEIKVSWGIF